MLVSKGKQRPEIYLLTYDLDYRMIAKLVYIKSDVIIVDFFAKQFIHFIERDIKQYRKQIITYELVS